MDSNKKEVLLLWFTKVWGRDVESISDLQDGKFFHFVLRNISHCNLKDELDGPDTKTRILTVKKFLQDFYGTDDSNDVLNYDAIFNGNVKKREMELAKVAVVLLGLAVIDKKGGDFVKRASKDLPEHLHVDLVCLLESVIQMHGPKFILSSSIEEALQTCSGQQGGVVLESWFQTPTFECLTDQEINSPESPTALPEEAPREASPPSVSAFSTTPMAQIRRGSEAPLNTSFGITSPLRDLNISSVSPFVTYMQSPQLIRKAILKEKELELRALKTQLNEQVLLKEDVQLSLREQMEHNAKKDSKIDELKHNIKELQSLQDDHDELQELKPKFAELEAKCDKLTNRQQKLDHYRSECQILETETKSQRDEIQTLHQEILSLKNQGQERTEVLKTNSSLEKQLELLKVQLGESSRMRSLMEEELASAKANLEITDEKYKELKKQTEDFNEDSSFQGESMGVIVDLQLVEMKAKVDKLSQARDDLQAEIQGLVASAAEQSSVMEDMRKQIESSSQLNESLVQQLKGKAADLDSLKSETATKESDHKSALASLKTKYEDDVKTLQSETERKIASLVEGHEVSSKRLQTATEKVVLEKDSVVQELKELERKMECLQADHVKELDVTRRESEKQLASQKFEMEQEVVTLQQQNESRRASLVSEHGAELLKTQEITEQKLSLQREKFEIELLKVQEKNVCEIKAQKVEFEKQVTVVKDTNNEMTQQKETLEKEMVALRIEMAQEIAAEKGKMEEELKTLKEEREVEILNEKNRYDQELSALEEESNGRIRCLEEAVEELKEKNEAAVAVLEKDHAQVMSETEQRMSAAALEHGEEVKDFHRRLQEYEEGKNKAREETIHLEETASFALKKQQEDYVNQISDLQQERDIRLIQIEEDRKKEVESLETNFTEKLSQQKDNSEARISKLQLENNDMANHVANVESQLTAARTKCEETDSQIVLMQQELLELSSQKTEVEEKLESVQERNSECLSSKASLEEEMTCLQGERSELLSLKVVMEEQVAILLKEKSDMASSQAATEDNVTLLNQEIATKTSTIAVLEERVKILQHEKSDIVSSKDVTVKAFEDLKQENSEIKASKATLEEKVSDLQQQISEVTSQMQTSEHESETLQERLCDLFNDNNNLEVRLESLEMDRSDMSSDIAFMEEELSCLKSDRSGLEVTVADQQREIAEICTQMAASKETLSDKEKEYEEIVSIRDSLRDELTRLQGETTLSQNRMVVECDLKIEMLTEKHAEEMSSVADRHEAEIEMMEEEKSRLVEETEGLKKEFEVAVQRTQELDGWVTEKENSFGNLQNEMVEKLERNRVEHEEHMLKLQTEFEEKLAAEKEQLETAIVNKMREDSEEKILELNIENEKMILRVEMESDEKLKLAEEEHSKLLVAVREEGETTKGDVAAEFEKRLGELEREKDEKLTLQKEEFAKQVAELQEEKNAQELLVMQTQKEAAENVNLEAQKVMKLNEEMASLEADKLAVSEQIAALQVETSKAMQLQKEEHEKEMQSLQEENDVKFREVMACCEKEVEALKIELEAVAGHHKVQMEEEVAKAHHEAEVAYEATLDDLKVQFEAAKESELKTLSDQKMELLALKEEHENEATAELARMDQKWRAVQEENNQLMGREAAFLKSAEAEMKTANEFCNGLRQQLGAANSQLKSTSSFREKIQLYDHQLSKLKETNVSLINALKIEKETSLKMHKRLESHITKHEKTRAMFENAQKEARVYAIENNRLKTLMDYSERKLKSYKQQLDQAGNMTIGSDAHFRQILEERESVMDNSFDANTSAISSYSLRSTTSSNSVKSRGSARSGDGSPNETIISADSVMLRRETLASSSDLKKPSVFRPTMQSCANEPEEYEWDRLSELKRRNTLCLPHLRSTYPVEAQVKKELASEEEVRLSLMPDEVPNHTVNHGKRRSPRLSTQHPDEDDKTVCPNKMKKEKADENGGTTIYFPLARDGDVYQPPSATTTRARENLKVGMATRKKLTPSKLPAKSPNRLATKGRSYKSPGLKTRSPARSRNAEAENKGPVSFNIVFTPKKAGGVNRPRLAQKKTADQSDNSVSCAPMQMQQKIASPPKKMFRKPLGTRNFRETGI